MTKVVIISVPYTEPLPMLAPVLLSACLNNAGISAAGIDVSIKFLNEFNEKPYWPDLKNLLAIGLTPKHLPLSAVKDVLRFIKRILTQIKKDHNPEYLGLSIFTNESINFSYLLVPYIRKYLPDTKIMFGGRGLELTCGVENRKHYEKYYDHGLADICVVGDAETAVIEVIQNNVTGIYFSKQQTKEDLDNIPVPNWKDYDFQIYKNFENYAITKDIRAPYDDPRYIAITGSKGCVRNCTFCDVASFWPDFIYRDGQKIADEIITNYQNTGINYFKFTDNLMNGSISHYRRMNQRLAEVIPNTIKYQGFAIFRSRNQMSEEDFEIAAVAGCKEWRVGVESGSERIRFEMRKKFNNDDLDYGIINLHKNKILQTWLLMVGYPTETEEDYIETEELLRRHVSRNDNGAIRVAVTPTFMMLHNSPLIQDPELKEQYKINFDNADNQNRYFWTSDVNPENTFKVRKQRWIRIANLINQLKYAWSPGMPFQKYYDELEAMERIYDEKHHKKVFIIHRS